MSGIHFSFYKAQVRSPIQPLPAYTKNFELIGIGFTSPGLASVAKLPWKFALKHPGIFAAIAPVCAEGDTSNIWKLRNIAVWAFHGAKDDIVPPAKGKRMVDALKKYILQRDSLSIPMPIIIVGTEHMQTIAFIPASYRTKENHLLKYRCLKTN